MPLSVKDFVRDYFSSLDPDQVTAAPRRRDPTTDDPEDR